ncbi:MAG: hypothetical protein RIQ89_939 [Bacteroidota bacterium]|jgi:hypothetical protein
MLLNKKILIALFSIIALVLFIAIGFCYYPSSDDLYFIDQTNKLGLVKLVHQEWTKWNTRWCSVAIMYFIIKLTSVNIIFFGCYFAVSTCMLITLIKNWMQQGTHYNYLFAIGSLMGWWLCLPDPGSQYYWFTAHAMYLLPGMALLYLLQHLTSHIRMLPAIIAALIVGGGSEATALAALGCITLYLMYNYIKYKFLDTKALIILLITLVSLAIAAVGGGAIKRSNALPAFDLVHTIKMTAYSVYQLVTSKALVSIFIWLLLHIMHWKHKKLASPSIIILLLFGSITSIVTCALLQDTMPWRCWSLWLLFLWIDIFRMTNVNIGTIAQKYLLLMLVTIGIFYISWQLWISIHLAININAAVKSKTDTNLKSIDWPINPSAPLHQNFLYEPNNSYQRALLQKYINTQKTITPIDHTR